MRSFDGDLRDTDSKTPWELSVHNALMDIDGFENVVRLRDGKNRRFINADEKSVRMYVEWCPGGDLKGIVEKYIGDDMPIPEPMIWAVAESLADCAKAMEDGHSEPQARAYGWKEVVHRCVASRVDVLVFRVLTRLQGHQVREPLPG